MTQLGAIFTAMTIKNSFYSDDRLKFSFIVACSTGDNCEEAARGDLISRTACLYSACPIQSPCNKAIIMIKSTAKESEAL